jgi:hypothetical protein
MSDQTEMPLSEALRLKSRRCAECGSTEKPRRADASGAFDADPDPKVVVSYVCTNRQCGNSSGW